jgi:hypothetical protein
VDTIFEWNSITNQGPVFWTACAAVALGLAMIVGAAVAQARRLRSVRPLPADSPEAKSSPREETPAAEEGTCAALPAVAAPRVDPARRRLTDLLERLDRVAASIESLDPAEWTASPGESPESAGETPLKDPADGVEYVFRAAGG